LETSRIHGILKGQNRPLLNLSYVLNDEMVQIGEKVFTSGEDRIFPKGVPVGVVVEAHPGSSFEEIAVQPFVKLNRLEEVLVVTKSIDVDLAALPGAPQNFIGPRLPVPTRSLPAVKPPALQPGSAALAAPPSSRTEELTHP